MLYVGDQVILGLLASLVETGLQVNLDLGESLKQKSHLSGSRSSDKTVCFDLILSRRTLARI